MSKSEADSIEILQFLASTPSPSRGIREVSEATGVPYTECHRYLNAESWESFTERELENLRRYRPAMYAKLIETVRFDEDGRIWLNRSKRQILLNYAHKNGYEIAQSQNFPGFAVAKVRTDGIVWNMLEPTRIPPNHTSYPVLLDEDE